MCIRDRQSRAVEAVVSAASDYLGELRGYYGPAFDQVKHRYGDELLARAARTLLSSGLQPLNPLLLIELAYQKMQKTKRGKDDVIAVSYTHLRAHETVLDLVCRLLLEKKKQCSP